MKSVRERLAPVVAVPIFSITGVCRSAYAKKGNHYIVNDGAIWSESGQELVRLRHTSVFQIRAPNTAS